MVYVDIWTDKSQQHIPIQTSLIIGAFLNPSWQLQRKAPGMLTQVPLPHRSGVKAHSFISKQKSSKITFFKVEPAFLTETLSCIYVCCILTHLFAGPFPCLFYSNSFPSQPTCAVLPSFIQIKSKTTITNEATESISTFSIGTNSRENCTFVNVWQESKTLHLNTGIKTHKTRENGGKNVNTKVTF